MFRSAKPIQIQPIIPNLINQRKITKEIRILFEISRFFQVKCRLLALEWIARLANRWLPSWLTQRGWSRHNCSWVLCPAPDKEGQKNTYFTRKTTYSNRKFDIKKTQNTDLGQISILGFLPHFYQNWVNGLDSDRFCAPEHICEL